ncbi:MAG TPA: DUF6159 family protein [Longimicrobiales bacterium]|nr:DUF6159 family protein [Longimicrobiales bacterium]
MAGSFSNSWALVKASANVLRLDKELMVFPLLSGVATVLVLASFVAPLALTGGWQSIGGDGQDPSYLAYVLGFLFYLIQYTVIFFFNSALVGAALIRLDGGDPSVSDGLSIAFGRLPAILGYAAVAATVGMILRAISERSGIVGRIVMGLVGMAWTLATYLAVPVLVTKNVGPIDAVKESAQLFRRTWGEQVVGNFGMGWAIALMLVSWTLVSAGLVALGAQFAPTGVFVALALAVAGYVFLALLSSALKGIYTAALYRYASTGDAGGFDAGIVGHAFRPRR